VIGTLAVKLSGRTRVIFFEATPGNLWLFWVPSPAKLQGLFPTKKNQIFRENQIKRIFYWKKKRTFFVLKNEKTNKPIG